MAKQATFVRDGGVIQYTNPSSSTAIEVGDVVSLGTRIGVALAEIPASGVGAVQVTGIWQFTAENDAAFTVGAAVYWDIAASNITATNTGDDIPAGWAAAVKGETATTCKVKIG